MIADRWSLPSGNVARKYFIEPVVCLESTLMERQVRYALKEESFQEDKELPDKKDIL